MDHHFVRMSDLGKTWLFDLDGTIVEHNGYKTNGTDVLLDGVKEYWNSIPKEDVIILLTSREEKYAGITEEFLHRSGIRYTRIIYGLPYGERILVNDDKPSGLQTAYAYRMERNRFGMPDVIRSTDRMLHFAERDFHNIGE